MSYAIVHKAYLHLDDYFFLRTSIGLYCNSNLIYIIDTQNIYLMYTFGKCVQYNTHFVCLQYKII